MRYIYLTPTAWERIQNLPPKPPLEDPYIAPFEQVCAHFDDYCAGKEWFLWSKEWSSGHYENRGGGLKVIKERSVRVACATLSDDFLVCVDARLKADFVKTKGGVLKYTPWYEDARKNLKCLGLADFVQQ